MSLESIGVRRLAVLVFLVAAAVRTGALCLSPAYVQSLKEHVEVRNVAITLATTGDFADPYGAPTGKTAHVPPVAPFLTSLVYRIWGVTGRAEFVRGVLCSLCSALVCGLAVLFGAAIGLGLLAPFLGGLIAAAAPHGVQFHADLTELDGCLGAALFLGAMLALLAAVKRGPSWRRVAAFGALSGLAILTQNALMAPLSALLVAAVLPFARNPLRLPRRAVIGMGLVAAAVVLPWSVRNFVVFQQWVTVRSNFWLEFRIAHHDLSPFPATVEVHPFHSQKTRDLIRQVGEPAAFASLGHDGVEWVRRHPAEFALRTAKRVVHFWAPTGGTVTSAASVVVAAAALWGFLLLALRRHPAAFVIGLVWLTYPAVYYILQPIARYQQPIGFSLYLMGAVALARLWGEVPVPNRGVAMADACVEVP